ncbi:TonB-dependent receptor plug domain-containing protein [Pricia sp. S334]|uniref:TonB-dependent receptor plug domain-containing protein n=1 Tax=Pricia mediterranea TaxID=3076079 RepID=A0ABU3L2Q2_9FLAO|nr:carboxypeptidase-like regulatory domain-containing protein [Pricia sp. S334]MDT7828019.1 TonB-dependent receptor plug domain-containing protein [Pricia sp. S334]
MKLSVLFTFTALLTMYANDSYAQRTKITIDLQNVPVTRLLDEIESRTDFRFVYRTKEVDLDRMVSVKAEKERVISILEKVFQNTGTTYRIIDTQIFLKKSIDQKKYQDKDRSEIENNQNQQLQVSGSVTDADGAPLPGASIVEKGTTNGVQTDFDGNFSIDISDENATLVVSYIGFGEKEVVVNGQATINVQLEESAQGLDEVVVVGYGTSTKKDLTGAVATIPTEQLENRPVVSYQEALAGQMAGVQIQQTSAAPGNEGLAVRVRGSGSITAGQDPLYVIDGYPVEGSGFSLVNPSDIESIQVLKDASSTAIYGSRGSNGVVIVTTKKGKVGKPRVSYNAYFGMQQVAKKFDMMNTEQYLERTIS